MPWVGPHATGEKARSLPGGTAFSADHTDATLFKPLEDSY
jgi:hypothetical protein